MVGGTVVESGQARLRFAAAGVALGWHDFRRGAFFLRGDVYRTRGTGLPSIAIRFFG